jgi:hypothetical protein
MQAAAVALNASLGVVGLIAAAVAIAVAGIGFAISRCIKWYKKDANEAKKAAEENQKFADALDETKEKAKSLEQELKYFQELQNPF